MYLLFDIGGTNMRLTVSRDGETFDTPLIRKTPSNFEEGMNEFNLMFQSLSIEDLKKSAGGIRGVLDKKEGRLLNDYHLVNWIAKPLRKSIEEITGGEVFLENDTAMVGLGEATRGVGKDYEIVGYMTISTGVGGSRIVRKQIDVSRYGFEPGHMVVDSDFSLSPQSGTTMDSPGNLEALISGTAIERRFGKKPYEIEDVAVWDDVAKITAYGINNLIVHWSPDIIILGGGMMKKPGIPVEKVQSHLRDILKIYPDIPPIRVSNLGDFGGIHGALEYLKEKDHH